MYLAIGKFILPLVWAIVLTSCFVYSGSVLTDGTRIPPGADVVLEITLEEVSNSYL